MRQTKFAFAKEKLIHGGSTPTGQRKGPRPLSTKRPLHLVMKCRKRIFQDRQAIIQILVPTAHKFQLPIYSFAIAHDHIHFLTKVPSRAAYVKFIRALTGMLAKKLGKLLFTSIPFTRIASWGRDYHHLLCYLQQNWDETSGMREYESRGRRRKRNSA